MIWWSLRFSDAWLAFCRAMEEEVLEVKVWSHRFIPIRFPPTVACVFIAVLEQWAASGGCAGVWASGGVARSIKNGAAAGSLLCAWSFCAVGCVRAWIEEAGRAGAVTKEFGWVGRDHLGGASSSLWFVGLSIGRLWSPRWGVALLRCALMDSQRISGTWRFLPLRFDSLLGLRGETGICYGHRRGGGLLDGQGPVSSDMLRISRCTSHSDLQIIASYTSSCMLAFACGYAEGRRAASAMEFNLDTMTEKEAVEAMTEKIHRHYEAKRASMAAKAELEKEKKKKAQAARTLCCSLSNLWPFSSVAAFCIFILFPQDRWWGLPMSCKQPCIQRAVWGRDGQGHDTSRPFEVEPAIVADRPHAREPG